MFDSVGWPEILVLALVGLFVLGPERLPGAVSWVAQTVRQIKDYATGTRDQLRNDLGPEFEQFRQPLEDLRSVRDLDPRRAVRRHLFEDPPADGSWSGAPTPATPDPATAGGAVAGATQHGTGSAQNASTQDGSTEHGAPSNGAGAPLKGQSDRAIPLRTGEQAPLDEDAT